MMLSSETRGPQCEDHGKFLSRLQSWRQRGGSRVRRRSGTAGALPLGTCMAAYMHGCLHAVGMNLCRPCRTEGSVLHTLSALLGC